jgi:ABC-type Mn2+/Zn2+ transport system permease subunit
VIRDFIESWPLFWTTYTVGWAVAALLSLLGVVVVARDQVFLGAALSQVSTLGVACAMWIVAAMGEHAPAWMEGNRFLTWTATLVSVGAALVTTRSGGPGRESREAVTGWLFLLGAAGAVVVVMHNAKGEAEILRLYSSSSVLGAVAIDLWTFAALAIAAAVMLALWWRPILLWVMDPATAAASGVRTGLLQVALAAGLGVAIGLSIRVSGLIYTFGCLVLPALGAKSVCREVRSMFFVAPAIAIAAAVVGFVVANEYDYPPGQLTVTLLACTVPIGWSLKAVRRA